MTAAEFLDAEDVARPSAAKFLDADGTPPEPEAGGREIEVPVTYYSIGRSVGGADETEDGWTNRGFTSTGRNLTRGVVAVNDKRIPLGTVLRDRETGEAFLAADRHGNDDPDVVDVYEEPDAYTARKERRRFEVAGQLDKVPGTPDGIRQALQPFQAAAGEGQQLNGLIEPGPKKLSAAEFLDEEDGEIGSQKSEGGGPAGDELSFLEKVKERWKIGDAQAQADQRGFEAATGRVRWEDVAQELETGEAERAKGGNVFSEGFLSAVEMAPAMLAGTAEGVKSGVGFAVAGGAAAAVGGQLGPQAAAPEEIITVPVAAGAGFQAGQIYGAGKYWYQQGAGSFYHTLRKEGIPHEVASGVAQSLAVPYAAIEFAQVTKLVPGLKDVTGKVVGATLRKSLANLAKLKGREY
ncbi:MAG: hypothetical protein L0170_18680, partial [Acidobacteria bacterium]|nr:hypothetical protein [Acidobacteriota bacterium]